MRTVQTLNGWWDYRIGDGVYVKKQVPYSDPPVGFAECRKQFERKEGQRAFLNFDGVTYSGDVTLNGVHLGVMQPYSHYVYEITDIIKDENDLSVIISDTQVVFGPAEGWENYSGIIRDVYVEYTADAVIEDIIWKAGTNGCCTVDVAADAGEIAVELIDPFGRVAYAGAAGEFTVEQPYLWHPDHPYLYTLHVTLSRDGVVLDENVQRVGFKELKANGRRFTLNGEPIFLVGVNRHDVWGDQGHILTEEQMWQDLRMIKDAGANYVRLVHYPHHKKIIDIADEIGLLVSEEPGLWWSDMKNPEIVEGSLEVLRRTVLRDRNRVSVGFWLSFNECIFTLEFLKASADVCRALDDTRMVSGANCMDVPMTKKYFTDCGFDFYTMHPYAPTTERMENSARELNDKPLLLTEWGGFFVYENPYLFQMFVEKQIEMWQNPDDKPIITGAAYWEWAEMFELNRGAPACHEGILNEGLVDRYRNPKSTLKVYKDTYARINEKPKKKRFLEVLEFAAGDAQYRPVCLEGLARNQEAAWNLLMEHALEPIPRFVQERRQRVINDGPILPEKIRNAGELPAELLQKPIVLNQEAELTVPVHKDAKALYILGNVSMPKGFPIGGVYGETVAVYEIEYADGTREAVEMHNGQEISSACAWYGPSRINPRASKAPRAIHFIHDMDREHYVINRYYLPLAKEAVSLTMKVVTEGYDVLTYGVTEEL